MLPWALVFFGLGAVIILLCLGLQGREEMHYVLDKSGAHLQKWIEPGRIRCYARFLPYESYNIAKDNEGNARMLIGESHILWEDVCRYQARLPHRSVPPGGISVYDAVSGARGAGCNRSLYNAQNEAAGTAIKNIMTQKGECMPRKRRRIFAFFAKRVKKFLDFGDRY